MPSDTPPRRTILAVDDSVSMQEIVKQTLRSTYKVMVANNTVEALAFLHHESIDLLLLDVSMPGVNGLELCRIIRRSPHLRDLPIIMLTARDSMYDKIEGRLAGATEYLTKPFDATHLKEVVQKILAVTAEVR
ncbi:response regulator [Lyngbya sp. CCY1209]|jgi:twitching motility two-component system response regulator PilG|uniref:response regulator n=1 Tax=Lyngbya sp. CCY1209 TaxID=2886103 RepID=UPI002D1FCF02|nr:response regulator [Lyngbya sp. CCY1209]MEB3886797.1 response regulator [Lyngbya sp. CCY1209]